MVNKQKAHINRTKSQSLLSQEEYNQIIKRKKIELAPDTANQIQSTKLHTLYIQFSHHYFINDTGYLTTLNIKDLS